MEKKAKKKKRTFKLKCHFSPMKIARGEVVKGFRNVELALHHAKTLRFKTEFKYFEVWRGKEYITRMNTLDYNFDYSL